MKSFARFVARDKAFSEGKCAHFQAPSGLCFLKFFSPIGGVQVLRSGSPPPSVVHLAQGTPEGFISLLHLFHVLDTWLHSALVHWDPCACLGLLGVQVAHATQESFSLALRAQNLDQAVVQNGLEGWTSDSEKVLLQAPGSEQ